tara:strand:- start:7470 stop:7904 length:435 start_codon:yes stop_codon:yes gene_type:complete
VIRFKVHGQPVGKGRARFYCVRGRPRAYPHAATAEYEHLVALEAARAFRGQPTPIAGPVRVELVAVMRRPKSRQRRKDLDQREQDIRKPDTDNILKAVVDGLVVSGVLGDDACVWSMTAEKWMADKTEPPHAEITIHWGEAQGE